MNRLPLPRRLLAACAFSLLSLAACTQAGGEGDPTTTDQALEGLPSVTRDAQEAARQAAAAAESRAREIELQSATYQAYRSATSTADLARLPGCREQKNRSLWSFRDERLMAALGRRSYFQSQVVITETPDDAGTFTLVFRAYPRDEEGIGCTDFRMEPILTCRKVGRTVGPTKAQCGLY
jgi:hypothetical protein